MRPKRYKLLHNDEICRNNLKVSFANLEDACAALVVNWGFDILYDALKYQGTWTSAQRKVLRDFYVQGYQWIVKNTLDHVYLCKEKPHKDHTTPVLDDWIFGDLSGCIRRDTIIFGEEGQYIDSLAEQDDDEPFEIPTIL